MDSPLLPIATDSRAVLRDFLQQWLHKLEWSSGGGRTLERDLPSYELYPRDYLNFAEQELSAQPIKTNNLVNCVGHLKRAVDCQLDIFLHSIHAHTIFNKHNLKFDKKLEFLREAGVVSPRGLSRLNRIRNEMEHGYSVPIIEDLNVYFDLAASFVGALETTISLLFWHGEMDFELSDSHYVIFHAKLIDPNEAEGITTASIVFDWNLRRDHQAQALKATINETQEYAYFLRVHLLLSQRMAFVNDDYILSRL